MLCRHTVLGGQEEEELVAVPEVSEGAPITEEGAVAEPSITHGYTAGVCVCVCACVCVCVCWHRPEPCITQE